MKDALKSYLSFSRAQRMGIIVLGGLLVLLIAVRATMHYWVRPESAGNEQAVRAEWEKFKQGQGKAAKEAALPVNINTADYETLVSLTGIGPKTAEKIMKYREEKGEIGDIKELLGINKFPEATLKVLSGEIRFSDSSTPGE